MSLRETLEGYIISKESQTYQEILEYFAPQAPYLPLSCTILIEKGIHVAIKVSCSALWLGVKIELVRGDRQSDLRTAGTFFPVSFI